MLKKPFVKELAVAALIFVILETNSWTRDASDCIFSNNIVKIVTSSLYTKDARFPTFVLKTREKNAPFYFKLQSLKDDISFYITYDKGINKLSFLQVRTPFYKGAGEETYDISRKLFYNPYHPIQQIRLHNFIYTLEIISSNESLKLPFYLTKINYENEIKNLFLSETSLSHPEGIDMARLIFSPNLNKYLNYDRILIEKIFSAKGAKEVFYAQHTWEYLSPFPIKNGTYLSKKDIENSLKNFRVAPQIYPKDCNTFYFLDERIPPPTEFLKDSNKKMTPFERGWIWVLLNNDVIDENTYLVMFLNKSSAIWKNGKVIKEFRGYNFPDTIENIPVAIVNFKHSWTFVEDAIPEWINPVLESLDILPKRIKQIREAIVPQEELNILTAYYKIIKKSKLTTEITRCPLCIQTEDRKKRSIKMRMMYSSLVYANIIDPMARYFVQESWYNNNPDIPTLFALYRHYTTEDNYMRKTVHGRRWRYGLAMYSVTGSYRTKAGYCLVRSIASAGLSLLIKEPVDCYFMHGFDVKDNLIMFHSFCWMPKKEILLERDNPIENILVPSLSPLFYTSDKIKVLWEFHYPKKIKKDNP